MSHTKTRAFLPPNYIEKREAMDNENVPADAIAMRAEEVVKAAIDWGFTVDVDAHMSRQQWKLYDTLLAYGDKYMGLRAR